MWPPLAIRQRNGGSSGSGSRKLAATCPCRWSTPISGLRGRGGERLRGADADEQRPDQPGAPGHRERVDLVEVGAGLGERRVDDRVDQLEVVPRGDLGHDAAEARVQPRPARRSTLVSTGRPSTTAAQVSSQDVSMREDQARDLGADRGRLEPHDQGVLAVVVVVAAAAAGGAEAEAARTSRSRRGWRRGPRACSARRARPRRSSRSIRPRRDAARGGGRARPRRSSGARRRRSASRRGSRRARRAVGAARQMPDGFESSSTNIASDHGVGNERRSIESTAGQVAVGEPADASARRRRSAVVAVDPRSRSRQSSASGRLR